MHSNPGQQNPVLSTFLIQSPQDQLLTSEDWMHMRSYEAIWEVRRRGPRQFRSRLAVQWIPLYNVEESRSSQLFRYAILAFMSYQQNNHSGRDTIRYLDLFFQEAHNSIAARSIKDLVYASYIMAVYNLVAGESLEPAFVNCLQFSRVIAAWAKSGTVVGDELSYVEMLWQEVISSLYFIHREILFRGIEGRARIEKSFSQLFQILKEVHIFLPSESDISSLPRSMPTELICQKIKTVAIYLQIYFEYFLFQKSSGAGITGIERDADEFSTNLNEILEKLIQLITHLSNIPDYIHHAYATPGLDWEAKDFPYSKVEPRGLKSTCEPSMRDTALALLYPFARLLQDLLDPTAATKEDVMVEIYNSAIVLCRLCATFPGNAFHQTPMASLLVKRTLFWAGLILNDSSFPSGIGTLQYISDCYRAFLDY